MSRNYYRHGVNQSAGRTLNSHDYLQGVKMKLCDEMDLMKYCDWMPGK